jgi:hypothetical protein
MPCPKCGSKAITPVSADSIRMYCSSCKHTWHKGKEQENKEGTLHFEGIPNAKFIMDLVLQNQTIDVANRAMIVAQITTTLYDQWFEGFKVGLLADIVHQKDLEHGKDSIGPERTDREHRTGDLETSVGNDEDSEPGRASERTSGSIGRVKEFYDGVEITRPVNITLTEEQDISLATYIEGLPRSKILSASTDGISVKFELKL